MFKQGDYVVCLNLKGDYKSTKINFITKQIRDASSLYVERDINGFPNGADDLKFDKSVDLLDWRYATKEEIAEYDRLGKPYDVTTLKTEDWIPKIGDYIVITKSDKNWTSGMDSFNGKCVQVNDISIDGDSVCFNNSKGYCWNYSQKHFRKATPEEISEYNRLGHEFNINSLKSNDLLGIEDLVIGEYYTNYYPKLGFRYIIKLGEITNKSITAPYFLNLNNTISFYKQYSNGFSDCEIRKATEEEKTWLDACILANKFISKEEALKSKKLETSNFIVDKWYVNPKWEKTSIAKFKAFNNQFYFSEAYLKQEKSKTDCWSIFKGCNLATEEEILDYLPTDHPDRLAILNKGKTENTISIDKLPKKYFVQPENQEQDDILIKFRGNGHTNSYKDNILVVDNNYKVFYCTSFKEQYLNKGYINISFNTWFQLICKEDQEFKDSVLGIPNNYFVAGPILKGDISFPEIRIHDSITTGSYTTTIEDSGYYKKEKVDLIIEEKDLLDTKVNRVKPVKIDLVD